MPDISYSFYRTYCKLYEIEAQCLPLADDYSLRAADYTAKHALAPAGIFFASPNAPTGLTLSLYAISAIAAANPDIPAVVDVRKSNRLNSRHSSASRLPASSY